MAFIIIQRFSNFKPDIVNKSHCKATERRGAFFHVLHFLVVSGSKAFWEKMF